MRKYGFFYLLFKRTKQYRLASSIFIVFLGLVFSVYKVTATETTVTLGFSKDKIILKPTIKSPTPSQIIDEERGAAVVQYSDILPSQIKKNGRLPQTNEYIYFIQFIGWMLIGLTGFIILIDVDRGNTNRGNTI